MNTALVYLLPLGLILLAVGSLDDKHAARVATVGVLAAALAVFFYGLVGFGLQFGGIGLLSDQPDLKNLIREWSPFDVSAGPGWGLFGLDAFGVNLGAWPDGVLQFHFFHAALATSAVLLPLLAIAPHAKSRVVLLAAIFFSALVFPLVGNWVWGGGWLASLGQTLALGHGFVDYGGAAVVFGFGGIAALGALVGYGRMNESKKPELVPAHLPLLMIAGVALIFVALIGQNPLARTGISEAQTVTNLLAALIAGLIGAALYGWFVTGSPSPLLTTRGAAAGLVAMLAAAPFVPPWSALVIGLIAGLLVPLSAYALERLRVMDPTMIVSTFAVPGLWGVLALGIFADGHAGVGWNLVGAQNFLGVERQGVTGMLPTPPFTPDMPGQIQAQLFGSLAIAVFAFAAAWAIFYALRKIGRPKTPGIVPPPPPPPPPPVNKTKPAELPQ